VRTIGLLSDHASNEIPASHRDLVECPLVAVLTTVMADGYPQTSVVWCDFNGERVQVNTMRGFAKERNMRRDPLVTLLCYDPRRPLRHPQRCPRRRSDHGARCPAGNPSIPHHRRRLRRAAELGPVARNA
jgi:hypothetical protein